MIKNVIVEGNEFKIGGVKTIEIEGVAGESDNGSIIDFVSKTPIKLDGFKGFKIELYADDNIFQTYNVRYIPIYKDYYFDYLEIFIVTKVGTTGNMEWFTDEIYSFATYYQPLTEYYDFWLVVLKGAFNNIETATSFKLKLYYYEADKTTPPLSYEY